MNRPKRLFWATSNGLAAIVLIVVAGYYLLMEHRAHVFAALPWLILLLCPLMHFFMHGGHGHGGHGHDGESDRRHDHESRERD